MAEAIALATAMHFVEFGPHWRELKALPLLSLAILCFTAWPEEFLFRGLLQNMLLRTTKNETVGWVLASVLFGFSHITNVGLPNWRYVLLASIAGMFYGWTWRKTPSMFASARCMGWWMRCGISCFGRRELLKIELDSEKKFWKGRFGGIPPMFFKE